MDSNRSTINLLSVRDSSASMAKQSTLYVDILSSYSVDCDALHSILEWDLEVG